MLIISFLFLLSLDIKELRDTQQELSATLETKQDNTQKLQQTVDLQDDEIQRMHELKQKVNSLLTK